MSRAVLFLSARRSRVRIGVAVGPWFFVLGSESFRGSKLLVRAGTRTRTRYHAPGTDHERRPKNYGLRGVDVVAPK